jgi:hypothetical protein
MPVDQTIVDGHRRHGGRGEEPDERDRVTTRQVERIVAVQARRLRRGFTLGELEEKLRELGRPIPLPALSKIEKGQRRVDVDDLVALALALGVSPNLLLPSLRRPRTPRCE